TLAEEQAEFREAARAECWDSGEPGADLRRFDAIVAFGRTQSLAGIRAAAAPEARFIGYGSRATVGYVGRVQLANEPHARARGSAAARDLVLYDSEGCMSLHALFIERGGAISPVAFGEILAACVEHAAIEFPVGTRDPAAGAALATARNLAAFRAATGKGAVFTDASANYALFVDPPGDEPPAFLPRALGLYPVDAPAEALGYLLRHRIALEAFALAGDSRADLIALAVDSGAVRIARFGELQHPPFSGDHGGRPRVAD
ncbi:MAG: acyl-CoA reductase, partial [Rhodanobacteraceae bacterium]